MSPKISGERLWQSIMDMSAIGATPRGGVHRLALSDEDREARQLFAEWCRDAGCAVTVDRFGNMFARRAGRNPALPVVMIGSHLDSQPYGGKFDGAFGVLAGLEVLRTLNDNKIMTDRSIDLVNWTNEEGARFNQPMIGSAVFAGMVAVEEAEKIADINGITMGAELERIGFKGSKQTTGYTARCYLETHIEQGPILEKNRM